LVSEEQPAGLFSTITVSNELDDDDLLGIVDMLYEEDKRNNPGKDNEDAIFNQMMSFYEDNEVYLWVAKKEGKTVGYGRARITGSRLKGDMIYVSPEARGLCVGKTLLKSQIDFAIAEGLTEVYSCIDDGNVASLRVNQGLGFYVQKVDFGYDVSLKI
jgi:GNAT superfamily N-acetyltransferase